MKLSDLKHRYDIGLLLNSNKSNWIIAEVGVAYGQNAKIILDKWDSGLIILVDPYVKQDVTEYASNMDDVDFEAMLAWAKDHLKEHEGRFTFLRKFSNEALNYIPDICLDMVYLDGNHQNPVFDQDLKGWIHKVRKGGILGGHDYMDLDTPSYKCDVKSTVDRFVKENHYELHLTNDDDNVQSWFIQL